MIVEEPGSFRDRSSKIYYGNGTVLRGVDEPSLRHWRELSNQPFFKDLVRNGQVIGTETESDPEISNRLAKEGWAGVLRHERVPVVSYPYEWTFGMLQDAGLLYLEILERAVSSGWTLKDATAYNIQWIGARPVFIDIPSFEPYVPGQPWIGYRQFCMMFLIPLLLRAHRGIDYIPLLRSDLEGIDPVEAAKFFPASSTFSRWSIFSHVFLHGMMVERAAARGSKPAPAKPMSHSLPMVLGTIQSLARTVSKLRLRNATTTWSAYEESHSYDEDAFSEKVAFVDKHARQRHWSTVWDLGCNTGTFSTTCSPHADSVVAVDGDFLAIEKLYRRLKDNGPGNILPLVMNLANPSPNQGWEGSERKTLEERGKPDLILCLALIHHMVISANVPMRRYLKWLRSLDAAVIIEFVGPDDEMTQELLKGRANQYADFTQANFEHVAGEMFTIVESAPLKGGRRAIYFLRPRK